MQSPTLYILRYTTYILESVDNDELRTMAQIYLDCIFNPLFLYDESIFLNEAINYKKYELFQSQKKQANPNGFGKGYVRKNFNDCIINI